MELEEPVEESGCLTVSSHLGTNNRCAAEPQFFKHIFHNHSARHVCLKNITLSAAQSSALATNPQAVRLTLLNCTFEDEGSAFVKMLEKRQSSFGSLTFERNTENEGSVYSDDSVENEEIVEPIGNRLLKRLLQVDVITYLRWPFFIKKTKLANLALSSPVESLDCFVHISALLGSDLSSLRILASRVSLTVAYDFVALAAESALTLFRRLAEFGHFVELKITFNFDRVTRRLVSDCIVQELIRTAHANGNMNVLDLSTGRGDLKWSGHLEILFNGLKDHKSLRILKLTASKDDFGPEFSHLRAFLSQNRNITVTDYYGNIYSDGLMIDALYGLNRFYRGSVALFEEPPSERSSFVATSLMESASNHFQRSALLLSDHVDALADLIQLASFSDHIGDYDFLSQSNPGRKRRNRT